jgi:hypothetical protein
MTGCKDVLVDLPDSEYEEAVGFLNDTLAVTAEEWREYCDGNSELYSNQEGEMK